MDIDYRAFFLYFFFSLHRYILSYGYAGSLLSHLRVNEFPEEIKFQDLRWNKDMDGLETHWWGDVVAHLLRGGETHWFGDVVAHMLRGGRLIGLKMWWLLF